MPTYPAPLSSKEERKLLRLAQRGDRKARELLVAHNMRFVMQAAHRMVQIGDREVEDYAQEGAIGLYIAISKFDLKRPVRFLTYATHWIKAQMRNLLLRDYTVHWATSGETRRLFFVYPRAIAEMSHAGGDPTAEQVAAACQVSVSVLNDFLQRSMHSVSLDAEIAVGETTTTSFLELLESPAETVDIEFEAESGKQELRADVASALTKLDPRELRIVKTRILCDAEDRMTLVELGIEMNCSRERIRQLEIRALKKLRQTLSEPLQRRIGNRWDADAKRWVKPLEVVK